MLIRDFSVGWTWQHGSDSWNGTYEWSVQPMNVQHNPALDLYQQAKGDINSLAAARPKDFIAKKSTIMPSNIYQYDSYVKEVVED